MESKLSPAEIEATIRRGYLETQRNIDRIIHELMDEYRKFEDLGETIARIDCYGADKVFNQPIRIEIPNPMVNGKYEF